MTRGILLSVLLVSLSLAGCSIDPERDSRVYQGRCIAVEDGGRTLRLANDQPGLNPIQGESATFDISSARVGARPEPGDVVRLAFVKRNGSRVALKVMNVTKQDLSKQ